MGSLTALDYVYVLLSALAGIWEAWCFNYGRDNIRAVALVLLMGFPFAALSYAHDRLAHRADFAVPTAQQWKRLIALWAGMPLSFVFGALAAGGTTMLVYAIAQPTNFPGYLPFSVLLAVAGLAWTCCMQIWLTRPGSRLFSKGALSVYLTVVAGILLALAFSSLILRAFRKDLIWQVMGIVLTELSAGILTVFPKSSRRPASL